MGFLSIFTPRAIALPVLSPYAEVWSWDDISPPCTVFARHGRIGKIQPERAVYLKVKAFHLLQSDRILQ